MARHEVPPPNPSRPTSSAGHPGAVVSGSEPAPIQVRPLVTRPAYLLLVVLGGAVGTLARHLAGEAAPARPGGWPWTTLWINVVGSFVLGALLTALARRGPDEGWRRRVRLSVGTGLCGGFTTYSTFVLEIDTLLRGGWVATALGYALVSVVAGIAAALAGVLLMRSRPRHRTGVAA